MLSRQNSHASALLQVRANTVTNRWRGSVGKLQQMYPGRLHTWLAGALIIVFILAFALSFLGLFRKPSPPDVPRVQRVLVLEARWGLRNRPHTHDARPAARGRIASYHMSCKWSGRCSRRPRASRRGAEPPQNSGHFQGHSGHFQGRTQSPPSFFIVLRQKKKQKKSKMASQRHPVRTAP